MYCTNYVIRKGDTLYSISRQLGVKLDAIMAANPLVDVYNLMIGETICIPVSIPSNNYTNITSYMVQEGDTLGSILNHYGVNLADLMQINKLNEIYLLPGTTLQMPSIDEGEDTL
jgi:LysM repeat protein